MSQHDMDIADQAINTAFPDVTLALKALASSSTGAAAPGTTFAGQLWADETNDLLKIRNKANGAWITLGEFDYTNGRFEYSANVFHALTAAGFTFKNAAGTTVLSLSDTGVLSGADITVGSGKTFDVSGGTLTLADDQVGTNKVAAASTTARGSVEKATTLEAEGGTTGDKFMDDVLTKAAIAAQTTSYEKTSWTAGLPPINATTSTAHSLGVVPDIVTVVIECTTAEHGFVIGDRMAFTSFFETQGGTGVNAYGNSSNLYVERGNYGWKVPNAPSFANLTEASWKHRLIAAVIVG